MSTRNKYAYGDRQISRRHVAARELQSNSTTDVDPAVVVGAGVTVLGFFLLAWSLPAIGKLLGAF